MTRIKLYCRGAMARAQVEGPLTHAMTGIPVEIQWDEAWNGLAKTMKIRCAEVCRTAIVAEDGTAVIPYECLIAGQRLEIGMDGWSQDGTLRIPSSWASCGMVKPSVAQCDGPEGAPPTVDTMTQLLTMLEKAEEAAKEAEQSAGDAAGSAGAAAGSASAASDVATEAEGARDEAVQAASDAAGSAGAAAGSASAASDAATEAECARDEAVQAAGDAAGSAGAAAGSASAASDAATEAEGARDEAVQAAARAEEVKNSLPDDYLTLIARLKSGAIEDAELHLGFYLDADGDLCQKED